MSAQSMAALRQANKERLGRKELCRAIKAHELSLPAALEDPRAQRMTIGALLEAQWHWGPDRAWVALVKAGRLLWPNAPDPPPLLHSTPVGDLPWRWREVLIEACGETRR